MKKFLQKIDFKIISENSENLKRIVLLLVTSILVTMMMTSVIGGVIGQTIYREGEIAKHSIRSSYDFNVEDTFLTEKNRAQAQAGVKRIFIFDDRVNTLVTQSLSQFFDMVSGSLKFKDKFGDIKLLAQRRANIEQRFGVKFTLSEWEIIERPDQWTVIEEAVLKIVRPVYELGIVRDRYEFHKAQLNYGVILHMLSGGGNREFSSKEHIYDLKSALEFLPLYFPTDESKENITGVAKKLSKIALVPNVYYDNLRTEEKIFDARRQVSPTFYHVRRGESIVRAGDTVSSVQERKLYRLSEIKEQTSFWEKSTGYFILTVVILVTLYYFALVLLNLKLVAFRDLVLIASVLLSSFVLLKIFSILAESVSLAFPDIDSTALLLATPVAAGSILLQVILGPTGVFMFLGSFGLLTGLYLEDSWLILLLIVIGGILGATSVCLCSRRSSFLIAGLKVALINFLITFCYSLLNSQAGFLSNWDLIFFATCGGIFSGLLAVGLTPIAEYLGSYITDIKLLELASLDRPLLRDLSLQAPGTWNHSMVMGQIGEAAAKAVGANALLTRVGAYYHDIGKIKKPAYFMENQIDKENRHDKLTPSMSSLIIKTHVKDGVELAKQHRLPSSVTDFIPQHHGTALIEYFFDKAKNEAQVGEVIDESHYRYPGPKPQTKEAGILMLADAVEAASRTVADPSPTKLQGLVQKIINKVFSSGQLNECELTLKDLHLIAKNFTRVLTGIYHKRVEYLEPAEKVKDPLIAKVEQVVNGGAEGEVKVKNVSRNTSEATSPKETQESPPKKKIESISTEALKRLGMH